MLEGLRIEQGRSKVFRLGRSSMIDDHLNSLQLDDPSRNELHEIASATGSKGELRNLIDAPFRKKRKYKRQTRFSDGSFPVFYSSLESATAKAEISYWLPEFLGKPKKPRKASYMLFSCEFEGRQIDLRNKTTEWPDLIHDSDYGFCNSVGAEAVRKKLDGLVTFSARCPDGVNLPVFSRDALSNPEFLALMEFSYDPDTRDVSISRTKKK